jgi:outer membrane beta-barrel protein
MESRIQRVLVTLALAGGACLSPVVCFADTKPEALELEPLVVREPERREIKVDEIDSENFEIGGFGGVMSIQDFGSDVVYGVRAAYHVTEDLFVEATYGMTELGETSFERLSGDVQILDDDQREFSFYNVSFGYNVFPGEAFVGRHWAFRGGLYLIGGAGSSDFAGDQEFTVNVGFGYRLAATDWLSLRIDVRDHMFETDLLGSEELTHNLEFTGGLTIFF